MGRVFQMYWDYNNPYIHGNSRDKWKFRSLCKKLNGERRDPYPNEWDFLIQYMYPEEDRILDKLDYIPQEKEEMVSVYNYTYQKVGSDVKEERYIEVPLSEKEDYT